MARLHAGAALRKIKSHPPVRRELNFTSNESMLFISLRPLCVLALQSQKGDIVMRSSTVILDGAVVADMSPTLEAIVRHLCEGECHAYGDLIEWCESRNDCIVAVVCPTCDTRFLIEDDDLVELQRWTESNGFAFGCGVALAG